MVRKSAAAIATVVALVVAGLTPAAAGAHSIGVGSYVAQVEAVPIDPSALDVTVIDMDAGLHVRSTLATDLELLDPDGNVFARVGPSGAFRRTITDDDDRPLKLQRVSSSPDLEVSYPPMGTPPDEFDPRSARDRTRVSSWSIPVRTADGRTGTLRGGLFYEPAPTSWLDNLEYVLTFGAVGAMVGVFVLDARRRRTRPPRHDASAERARAGAR